MCEESRVVVRSPENTTRYFNKKNS